PVIEISKNCIQIAGCGLGCGPLHVFGSGKAAVSMTIALQNVLKTRITGGIIVSPEEPTFLPPLLRHFIGDHPIPTTRSHRAGKEIMQKMAALKPSDRFVYLLSGGSSALMEVPAVPLSIRDIAAVTELLLSTGLSIEETNLIRTHLSYLKGGGLSEQVQAKGIVLIMSDVLDNSLSVIGSGPLRQIVRDYETCENLLRDRNLWNKLPAAVRSFMTRPQDSSKQPKKTFPHEIVADNKTLLRAVQKGLEKRKVAVLTVSDHLGGEAADAGRRIADLALNVAESSKSGEKLALVFSGETTVTVKGNGIGGRCQELALAALTRLRGNLAITLFAAGSDGRDGPTDAAGAIADRQVWINAQKLRLFPEKYMDQNDSYRFFQSTSGLIKTGPTGINLLDMVIALIHF
ncbi:MAG: DUF4147 domain-containing protein, partial [Holophagae bacterium]|nr:DUF4147 domain-containing protein [Holophagae bacterium]